MAKAWRRVPERNPFAACAICGGTDFLRGPQGRTGPTGVRPRCSACGALERHRAYRVVFETIRASQDFGHLSVLQFSREPTLEPEWFVSFEVSEYGGDNSLDLQRIDRPDASYGLVMCNNVLEHVADDRAALAELGRICRPDGFVFLAVPDPLGRDVTKDWGFADPAHHGHYRLYGADIGAVLAGAVPDHLALSVVAVDPTTRTRHAAFVLTRSTDRAASIEAGLPNCRRIDADPAALTDFLAGAGE